MGRCFGCTGSITDLSFAFGGCAQGESSSCQCRDNRNGERYRDGQWSRNGKRYRDGECSRNGKRYRDGECSGQCHGVGHHRYRKWDRCYRHGRELKYKHLGIRTGEHGQHHRRFHKRFRHDQ